MTTLRFYFDFISPYAYLGWTQVQGLADRRGLTLEPIPVLFAAMLNTHGNKGPAEIAPKRLYTFKHVSRLAHDLGVPLVPPPAHPFNPLLSLRIASLPMPAPTKRAVITTLYERTWATGEGVTDADAVARALEQAGHPGAQWVEEAGTDVAKARVRTQTQAAIERGVFGVPSMEAGDSGEVFWGQDSLPHLERYLDGNDPLPADLQQRWGQLPVGSRRPGSQ